jgi:hypothetical protein
MAEMKKPAAEKKLLVSKLGSLDDLGKAERAAAISELLDHQAKLRQLEVKQFGKDLKEWVDKGASGTALQFSRYKPSDGPLYQPVRTPITPPYYVLPPYTGSVPAQEEREECTPPGIFESSSRLALGHTGELSVAVGAGQFRMGSIIDTYPADLDWPFGKYSQASATITETCHLPAPIAQPTQVTVTASFETAEPDMYWVVGAGGLRGLVAVRAVARLHLSAGDGNLGATRRREFMLHCWNRDVHNGYTDRSFQVSETITLSPGAGSVIIAVTGEVWAMLTPAEPEVPPGFAGVAYLTTTQHVNGIWLLGAPRGSIRVPSIKLEFWRAA